MRHLLLAIPVLLAACHAPPAGETEGEKKFGAIGVLTSTLNVSASFAGGGYPSGQPWTSGPVYNTPSPGYQGYASVAPYTTTAIAVPPGALWVRIDPPAASGLEKLFKTVSGDTGTPIPKQGPSFLFVFDQTNLPASVYLTGVLPGADAGASEQVFVTFG